MVKAFPLQAWTGPWSSRRLSRVSRQSAHECGKVVSPTHWPSLPPGKTYCLYTSYSKWAIFQHVDAMVCGTFFSWFFFDIFQIPVGCIQICSGCIVLRYVPWLCSWYELFTKTQGTVRSRLATLSFLVTLSLTARLYSTLKGFVSDTNSDRMSSFLWITAAKVHSWKEKPPQNVHSQPECHVTSLFLCS
jgi:hypothetical protein